MIDMADCCGPLFHTISIKISRPVLPFVELLCLARPSFINLS
jgi:hypothetical protein